MESFAIYKINRVIRWKWTVLSVLHTSSRRFEAGIEFGGTFHEYICLEFVINSKFINKVSPMIKYTDLKLNSMAVLYMYKNKNKKNYKYKSKG